MMDMMTGTIVLWLAFALALGAGAAGLVALLGRGAGRGATGDTTLATLRERYARGEIDRAEYEERRGVLAADAMTAGGAGNAMGRRRRLWGGGLLALLALAAVLTGTVAARGADRLPTSTDGPFMGVADPAMPYDLRFIDEMIMHHRGAIMSARMMIADSDRPELRDLARRIITGQQRQIDQMLAWRRQWYPDAGPPPMGMGGTMGGGMMGGGMMGGRRGDGADRVFLRMMIPHHQLAIEMAEDALTNAEHDELRGLAREIVADQSAEIAEMEGYLKTWYGEESTRGAAGDMRAMMRRMMGGGRR